MPVRITAVHTYNVGQAAVFRHDLSKHASLAIGENGRVCVPGTMDDTRRSSVQSLVARVSLANVQSPATRGGGWPEETRGGVLLHGTWMFFCNEASTPTGHTEVEITAVVYDSKLVDDLSTM